MNLLRHTGLLFAAAALAGCGDRDGKPDASGTVEVTEVRVAAEVPGRILELPVREGQALRRGDPVATLDPADYELRAAEARAAREFARAQLDLLKAGSRAEDIRRAEAQLREAQSAAWAAGENRKRVQQVFEQGSATARDADEARAAAERAAAAAAAADEFLARLTKGSRPEEIRSAEAAATQAEARLALAEKALKNTVVTAPLDGLVLVRAVEAGEVVAAGAPIATVADPGDAWLSIYIPEPRLAAVRIGSKVRVRASGQPESVSGVVSFVSPEAEFTPRNVQTADERAKLVYRVKVTLPNADGRFKPGQPADVWLE